MSEGNTPDRDKLLATLTRLSIKHERAINAIAEGLYDVASLLSPLITRCDTVDCNNGATVRHNVLGIKFCDYHCACTIVNAKNETGEVVFNNIRNSIKNEENWIEIENAESVRHITDYLKLTKDLQRDIITSTRLH